MIQSLGMIARCDQGGLGNQTFEIFKNVKPKHVVLMLLGEAGRGQEDIRKYEQVCHETGSTLRLIHGTELPDTDVLSLAARCAKVLSVETFYNPRAPELIHKSASQSVLIANPELYDQRLNVDLLRVPTFWEMDRMPKSAKILHHPVDRSYLPFRVRKKAEVFYHPSAPAMKDRNGTELVIAALKQIESPCKIIIRSAKPSPFDSSHLNVGQVELQWIQGSELHYWDSYPEEADVLLLPRRYGGLCLPLQESSSLGMPAIMTDLAPQFSFPQVCTVPISGSVHVPMKGGNFPVYECKAADVAAAVDELVSNPRHVQAMSYKADKWADAHSWEKLLPKWIGSLS